MTNVTNKSDGGGTTDHKATYGLAKDSVSTMITLSSGILAISLTFSDKWAQNANSEHRTLLWVSWLLFLLAVAAGLIAMHVLTGVSHSGEDIYQWRFRVPWICEILLFLAALIVFFIYGINVIDDIGDIKPKPTP
ncbi:hypothetical protein ACWDZW_06470 [Streptomyces coeruleorubidus]